MKNLLYLCFGLLVLSSCKTLVPFTENIKEQNNWTNAQIDQIQFYTSESITLYRQLNNNSTDIVSGKIKTVDGRQVEEIIIKKGTPGVVTAHPDSERLAISFEISDDYFLVFGVDGKRGDRYYLRLKEYKKGAYALVTYVDKVFEVHPNSLNAFLQVNMKKINKEQRKIRVAKGRKI